jgi:hypothetical protein
MKKIIVCPKNSNTFTVYAALGTSIKDIADFYPTSNLYWIDAPLHTKEDDRRVIRYIP